MRANRSVLGQPVWRLNRILSIAGLAAISLGMALTEARAQTINEILNNKKIVIGVTGGPPFTFINDKQQVDGFNVELARLVAKHMGVQGEIKYVEAANRIPYLVTKQVDMLVANLGITPERSKQVMNTNPYAEAVSVVVAPKSRNIKELSHLSGLRIAVGRASSNDIFLTELAPKDATIMRFEGEAAAQQALASGQVEALGVSENQTGPLKKANPQLEIETKIVLRRQGDPMTVRKDAFELKEWLNAMIYYIKGNGELDALYRKWLGIPLPDLAVF